MTSLPKATNRRNKPKPDSRKQLFNEGVVGPIKKIQVSTERIVKIRGILFDLDPPIYREGPLIRSRPIDPRKFYQHVVRPWLSHHPMLEKAEVRLTGNGLHVIPWLSDPIVIEDDSDREKWAAIVQVVQAALPVDPEAPGITATTRAIGSTNSKNNVQVVKLKKGEPVDQQTVLDLHEQMVVAPFKTVAAILTGDDRITPCPFCDGDGTALKALDYVGQCYECGKITLDQLYDLVLLPRQAKVKE